jgi:hypothetical protein
MKWNEILDNAVNRWYVCDDGYFYLNKFKYGVSHGGVTTKLEIWIEIYDEQYFKDNRRSQITTTVGFFTDDIYAFKTSSKHFDSIFRQHFADEDKLNPLLARAMLASQR